MPEEKGSLNKHQMGSWDLSIPGEKLSNMDPPPIIGSSSNNNVPLIADQNHQVDDGVNAEDDKTAPSRTIRGGRKRTTGQTAGGEGEGANGAGGEATDDHEMHIWTERERRKKMRNMFANLHALLPQLPAKMYAEGDKTEPSRTIRGGRKRTTCKTAGGEGKDANGAGGEAIDDHEMHMWTERERRMKMRNMFANLHALLPQPPAKADKSTIVDEAVTYIKSLEITVENLEKKKQERLKQAQQSADSSTTIAYDPSSVNINSQKHPYVSREAFMADHGGSSNHNSSTNNNLASTTKAIAIGTSPSLLLPGAGNNPVGFQTWSSSNVVVNICGDQAHFNVCYVKRPGLFTSICTLFERYKIEVLSAHVSSDDSRCFYMIHALAKRGSNEALSTKDSFRQAAGEMTLWLS